VVTNALWVGLGQSNEEGPVAAADCTNFPGLTTPEPAVNFIRWTALGNDPPTGVTRDPASGVGPLQSRTIPAGNPFNPGTFGPLDTELRTYQADSSLAGRVCGMAVAFDGSALDKWVPSSSFPNGAWIGSPDNLFTWLVKRIKEIQTSTNSSIRLGGLSAENGTSDALSSGLANAYYSSWDLIINGLWNAFSCHFPVVIGRISQTFVNNFSGASANGPTVRAAQVQWAGDNGFPWVDNDGRADIGDFAHYNSNSSASLGVDRATLHLKRRQRGDRRR